MRGVKKSRNGCARCKSQRLKCDEQKPACSRCVRVGVECPGYLQRLKWSNKYEVSGHKLSQKDAEKEPTSVQESRQSAIPEGPSSRNQLSFAGIAQDQYQDFFIGGESLGIEEEHWNLAAFDQLFPDDQLVTESDETPPDFDETVHTATQSAVSPRRQQPRSSGPHTHEVPEESSDMSISYPPVRASENDRPSKYAPFWLTECNNAVIVPAFNQTPRDTSSILTEYYFKETAKLFSCYDSPMNPFKTIVGQLWGSSPVINRTLQSMAAACLVETFPHLAPIGLQLRREAEDFLKGEEELDEKSLLAMIMLGGTASWHNPKDLGLPYFNRVRKRLDSMSMSELQQVNGNNLRFFQEAMTYWEMLLAYVADDDSLHIDKGAETPRQYFPSKHVPHPWTGVARDTQDALQEIGRLIRRQRRRAHARGFASQARIREMQQDMADASLLENRLLGVTFPLEEDIVSPQDRQTPVWHLLTLAQVYRRTGLLQLYRVFPDLLLQRLPLADLTAVINYERNFAETPANSISSEDLQSRVRNEWLTSMALETLTLLKLVPAESGTKDFQPFLLVALSSELRYSHDIQFDPSQQAPAGGFHETFNLSLRSIQIAKMRELILSRLNTYLHLLPPKPIHVCIDIVKATWDKMDAADAAARTAGQGIVSIVLEKGENEEDVYWMDVMISKGWETTMG